MANIPIIPGENRFRALAPIAQGLVQGFGQRGQRQSLIEAAQGFGGNAQLAQALQGLPLGMGQQLFGNALLQQQQARARATQPLNPLEQARLGLVEAQTLQAQARTRQLQQGQQAGGLNTKETLENINKTSDNIQQLRQERLDIEGNEKIRPAQKAKDVANINARIRGLSGRLTGLNRRLPPDLQVDTRSFLAEAGEREPPISAPSADIIRNAPQRPKVQNPFTGAVEEVPIGFTPQEHLRNLQTQASLAFTQDLVNKTQQAEAARLEKEAADLIILENVGNVKAVRAQIGSISKRLLSARASAQKETAILNRGVQTGQLVPGTILHNSQLATVAGARANVTALENARAVAQASLEKTQDVARTSVIAAKLQKLNLQATAVPIGDTGRTRPNPDIQKGVALIKSMWAKRTIKTEATAQQIFEQHVSGKFPDSVKQELLMWLQQQVRKTRRAR